MDKICFERLRFFAHHGYFLHERLRGQYFEIDLELSCNLTTAGQRDALGLDYGVVYQCVKTLVCERQFKLLEALAENICSAILESFSQVETVFIRLRKPEAPLEGGLIPDEKIDKTNWQQAWSLGQFGEGGAVAVELLRHA